MFGIFSQQIKQPAIPFGQQRRPSFPQQQQAPQQQQQQQQRRPSFNNTLGASFNNTPGVSFNNTLGVSSFTSDLSKWNGSQMVPQAPQAPQQFGQQQPAIPFGQPAIPFGQPAIPFGQPAIPFGQPAIPFGQPAIPFGQQIKQPAIPFGQPAISFSQPANPFGQSVVKVETLPDTMTNISTRRRYPTQRNYDHMSGAEYLLLNDLELSISYCEKLQTALQVKMNSTNF